MRAEARARAGRVGGRGDSDMVGDLVMINENRQAIIKAQQALFNPTSLAGVHGS